LAIKVHKVSTGDLVIPTRTCSLLSREPTDNIDFTSDFIRWNLNEIGFILDIRDFDSDPWLLIRTPEGNTGWTPLIDVKII